MKFKLLFIFLFIIIGCAKNQFEPSYKINDDLSKLISNNVNHANYMTIIKGRYYAYEEDNHNILITSQENIISNVQYCKKVTPKHNDFYKINHYESLYEVIKKIGLPIEVLNNNYYYEFIYEISNGQQYKLSFDLNNNDLYLESIYFEIV